MLKQSTRCGILVVSLSLVLFLVGCSGAEVSRHSEPQVQTMRLEISKVLSWFPDDTETFIFDRHSFAAGKEKPAAEVLPTQMCSFELEYSLDSEFLNQAMSKHPNTKINYVVEGSRNYRASNGIGANPYEGVTVIHFDEPIDSNIYSQINDMSDQTLTSEAFKINCFKQARKFYDDKTFVVLAKPNVLLISSSLPYLESVLSRIKTESKRSALPPSLREWQCVDIEASIWAVRHYISRGSLIDPSSPFTNKSSYINDPHAVGLTYQYDSKTNEIQVFHISDREGVDSVFSGWRTISSQGEIKFESNISKVDDTTVKISVFPQANSESVFFKLVVDMAFGHGASY